MALLYFQDKEGMTALHLAAIYGLKNFVKFLAKDFNAVNIKDIKGRIPLHYCAGEEQSYFDIGYCFTRHWTLDIDDGQKYRRMIMAILVPVFCQEK